MCLGSRLTNSTENTFPVVLHTDDNTLLLSHANPEDNEFALWLALQLATEDYRVWCDLTRLLGGEVFWDSIEGAIKTRAAKLLYVLSRTSNTKDGPLKELHFARGVANKDKLKDFVIPLHIDDLPYGDVTIEITRVNTVQFERSWGAGLAKLLEKLEEDKVPKDPKFNRSIRSPPFAMIVPLTSEDTSALKYCFNSRFENSGLLAYGGITEVVRNGNLQIKEHSFPSQQLSQG